MLESSPNELHFSIFVMLRIAGQRLSSQQSSSELPTTPGACKKSTSSNRPSGHAMTDRFRLEALALGNDDARATRVLSTGLGAALLCSMTNRVIRRTVWRIVSSTLLLKLRTSLRAASFVVNTSLAGIFTARRATSTCNWRREKKQTESLQACKPGANFVRSCWICRPAGRAGVFLASPPAALLLHVHTLGWTGQSHTTATQPWTK